MNKQPQRTKRSALAKAAATGSGKAGTGSGKGKEVTETASGSPGEVTEGNGADGYTPGKGNAARDANRGYRVAGLTVDISFILHILSSFSGTFIP